MYRQLNVNLRWPMLAAVEIKAYQKRFRVKKINMEVFRVMKS